MGKNRKKSFLKNTGIFAGCLLLGVSSLAVTRHFADKIAPEFYQTKVMVGDRNISIQELYENTRYRNGEWVYIAPDGKEMSVDSLCDSRRKNDGVHAHYAKVVLTERTDTVYASYGDEKFREENKSNIMYRIGSQDSLPNIPLLGFQNYDYMVIREFVADNPKLQKVMDRYNDSLNCTRRHEYQHYLNMTYGMREWNSYSVKFVECCEDEISANIAQCLEQRKKYMEHGKDFSYITKRFPFMKEALQSGKINSEGALNKQEQEFLANQIFDMWMDKRYEMYAPKNDARAKCYLKDAGYWALHDDMPRHRKLMKKCFKIDGYDFWPHIARREQEIYDRITPEQRKEYASMCRDKFRQMNYFEKLEMLKKEKGADALKRKVIGNVAKAQVIKWFATDR